MDTMSTISNVCSNLFTQTTLSELPRIPTRGARRNLARIVYREGRRPGLIDPQKPGPRPVRKKIPRRLVCVQRPMRHVYVLHEPAASKRPIRFGMIPRLAR